MQLDFEQCPLCGTELSEVKFREIQAKLHREEQEKAAALAQAESALRLQLEGHFRKEMARTQQILEKRANDEAATKIKLVASELDQTAKKLKEAEAREVEIRKQAEQRLAKEILATQMRSKEEAETRIKEAATDRDQWAKKAKEAEAREATVRKQVTEDAEKARLRELTQQRQVLENDSREALLRQQCESNRKIESIQKKLQQVEKQLQNKTANELGDGAEIDLFEALRENFPTDQITRVRKGSVGADIHFDVLYKGTYSGRIIIESKNRQDWKAEYVTKLRQDQVEASAEHAILATTFFPKGKKEMCIESDVIVISPGRVVYVIQLLRNAMVTMHVKGLSMKERATKMSRLYGLITSESYSRKFAEAGRLAKELLEVDVQEKTAHDNVWKRRGSLTKRVQSVLREVETEVSAVIESIDDEDAPSAFNVKSVPLSAAASRTQGIV